ncbi:MAG: glutamate racemase [Gemmatimonadota bacterium]|jgi:glutamate racemase|nr:glutamate racemase [Gemmatimonadota bacterium]
MSDPRPIGVFDSGLGGLSVAREIRSRLPDESIIYIADSAYVPYGGRPLEEIRERSIVVTGELVKRGAKMIIVACNTASGAAIEQLRARFSLPIVGLEPAVKPAAVSTRAGCIAVLATPATLQTDRFHRLVDQHGEDVRIVKIPCPGYVELVESGKMDDERALEIVREPLMPAIQAGVDRVVLGCTHYPFLRELIRQVLGDGVEILDSGAAVARQVERVLVQHELAAGDPADRSEPGSFTMLTTGDPGRVAPVASGLWGSPLTVGQVV